MTNSNVGQKYSTRQLNPRNRVLFSKSSRALARQLLVLREVNDRTRVQDGSRYANYFRTSFDPGLVCK